MSSKESTKMCTCGKADWCPNNPQNCGINNPEVLESTSSATPIKIEDLAAPLLAKYAKQ